MKSISNVLPCCPAEFRPLFTRLCTISLYKTCSMFAGYTFVFTVTHSKMRNVVIAANYFITPPFRFLQWDLWSTRGAIISSVHYACELCSSSTLRTLWITLFDKLRPCRRRKFYLNQILQSVRISVRTLISVFFAPRKRVPSSVCAYVSASRMIPLWNG